MLLVGWLRWRLFVNRLRTRRGKADLVSKVILGVVIGGTVLVLGPLAGVGAWYGIHNHQPLAIDGEFWGIFIIWLMVPILISGFGAESDPVSLLRYPLRYSTFIMLALGHAAFDPVSVAAGYWLAAMWVGIAVASGSAAQWAIPAIAAFALFNLLLNRVIFAWLSHWLSRRRTREILAVVFLLIIFSFQLIGPLSQRYGKAAVPEVRHVLKSARFFPPGLAASTTNSGAAGETASALAAFAGLVAVCAALGVALSVRLRAEYRGESVSETRLERAEKPGAIRAGFTVAGLSPVVAALLEKDVRYFVRNTMVFLTLAVPFILVVVMMMNRANGQAGVPSFMRSGAMVFPVSIGYVMLVLVGFAYNSLGYDGAGVAVLFAAPVRFRDVLVAKNLLHTMMVAVEMVLISVVDWIVVGPVRASVVLVTIEGAAGAILVNLAIGDLTSLYFPRKLNFGQMRRQQTSGLSVLISLGTQVVLAGFAVALVLVSRFTGTLLWCGAGFLALDLIGLVAYRHVLGTLDGLATRRRDVLLTELCR